LIATEAENQKRTEKTAEYAGCIEEAGAQLHSRSRPSTWCNFVDGLRA
jgi:hypothetical protein